MRSHYEISFNTRKKILAEEIKAKIKSVFEDASHIFIDEVEDFVETNYKNRWDCIKCLV